MVRKDEQAKTPKGGKPSARGSEDRTVQGASESNREAGTPAAGGAVGDLGFGDDRAAGAWGAAKLLGGILTRLIAEKQSRIREVQECLEWYQRELVQREEELQELQHLADQMFASGSES
jgi:hypothetical protein